MNNYTFEETSLILSAIVKKILSLEEDLTIFTNEEVRKSTQEELNQYNNLLEKVKKNW